MGGGVSGAGDSPRKTRRMHRIPGCRLTHRQSRWFFTLFGGRQESDDCCTVVSYRIPLVENLKWFKMLYHTVSNEYCDR